MKFNAGDRVTIIKSNLPEYVGEKATVSGPAPGYIGEGAVDIELDNKSIAGSWVVDHDGAIPWMEEWLVKE